jgi:uncharacterized protein (TIGR02145 family)
MAKLSLYLSLLIVGKYNVWLLTVKINGYRFQHNHLTLSKGVCMGSTNWQCRALLLAAGVVAIATGVFAQKPDTAYIPFLVNVDAVVMVAAYAGADGSTTDLFGGNATAKTVYMLSVPLQKTTGVTHISKDRANTPAIISNKGGAITVNLSSKTQNNAEISLYGVNGKRIFRRVVTAENTVNNISNHSIAPGVYVLSVKGNGNISTDHITHGGGKLNINVKVESDVRSSATKMTKSAAAANVWTIKVSATGRKDSLYTIVPVGGLNPQQEITLPPIFYANTPVIDTRDNKVYKTVTIGLQTWMAENLNYKTPSNDSWCPDNDTSKCNVYGRLYALDAALTACPSGWHLPTLSEWMRLIVDYAGGYESDTILFAYDVAGRKLRATTLWINDPPWAPLIPGTDDFGFSALPGGYMQKGGDQTYNLGREGYWWLVPPITDRAYTEIIALKNSEDYVDVKLHSRSYIMSVRCIQN